MGKFNKKGMLLLLAGLIITLFAATSVYAATKPILNNVKAYSGVKIVYNGNELTADKSPYIINDTTYIPLRMLMENFGKNVFWDSVNYRVVIVDGNNEAALKAQIVEKDAQIASLQETINQLNAKISDLEDNDNDNDYDYDYDDEDDLDSIEEDLADYFEDAGDEYFDDDGIETSLSLSGDEDEISYTIKLDFGDANDYDDIRDISQSDLKTFLNAVKSRINKEIDNTDYEDADIEEGKLSDKDHSNYYVKYNGSSYSFSWDEDSTSISDIRETLYDSFEEAGDKYFDDDGIDVTISLSGDDDDLAYTIKLDFSNANDFADLTELSTSKVKTFLNAVKSEINSEIDGTDYEDADLTGKLVDNDNSSYYVEYEDGSYSFSWD